MNGDYIMATDANALLNATPTPTPGPAADLSGTTAPAPVAADPNTLTFVIPNTETSIAVMLAEIPSETRLELLKKAVKDHIVNRVNQTNVRHTKALAPFTAYDEAMKVDPLQTAVPKPEGDRPTVDLLAPAAAARADLYAGKLRTQNADGPKARETKDPLTKAITDVVVRELFDKSKLTTKGYKWTDAVKAVGSDGLAYLNARIAEKVAQGADAAVLNKFLQDRYVTPAQIMLGITTNKATKDQSIL
jgi:hypothetical protein